MPERSKSPKGKQEFTWHDPPAWIKVMDGLRLAPLPFFGTGDGRGPEIVVIDYAPNIKVPVHYHQCDYCSIVVSGTVRVNRTWHGVGDMRIVKSGTAYSLKAGEEGCRLIEVFTNAERSDAIPVAASARAEFEQAQRGADRAIAALGQRAPTQ
jgi:hypothetical protein